MTKNTKEVPKFDGAAVANRIAETHEQLKTLHARCSKLQLELYADTFAWVTHAVSSGACRTEELACQSLAKRLSIPWRTVVGWMGDGRFMHTHRIRPNDKAKSGPLHDLRCAQARMPKADFLRALSEVKKGETSTVRWSIRAGEKRSGHDATRRRRRMEKAGKWNKRALKLELHVIAAIASEFFGQPIHLDVTDPNTAEVLLHTESDAGRAEKAKAKAS